MLTRLGVLALLVLACATGCQAAGGVGPRRPKHAAAAKPEVPAEGDEATLAHLQRIHGDAGPWVVAGYRMGIYALGRLKLPRGSEELEVTHHAPNELQFSSLVDGAAAATGTSLGQLNLHLEEVPAEETRTTFRNRSSKSTVTLATTPEFNGRYASTSETQLSAAGKDVLHLNDGVIFREVTGSSP